VPGKGAVRVTQAQGKLVAYVYWYTKIHRVPPAENEIAAFLGIRGPSAHQMLLRLESKEILSRRPGEARTIKILLPREEIPDLE
jgi:Mn-dependent DtxR family transcriptional regulator